MKFTFSSFAKKVVEDVATTSGPPPYFLNLVNKIRNLGDDTLATKDKAIAKTPDFKSSELTFGPTLSTLLNSKVLPIAFDSDPRAKYFQQIKNGLLVRKTLLRQFLEND